MKRSPEGLDRRVADRFEQVAITSARFAAYGRTAAVVIVGLWLFWTIPAPRVYYYEALLAVFIALGWLHFRVSLRAGSEHWLIFLFAFVDMGLLTFAILSENPFEEVPLPVALHYRFDGFIFFFLLFAGVLHSYSPRLVLWSGVSIAFWWAGALALSVQAPGVVTEFDLPSAGEMSRLAFVERTQQSDFIEVLRRLQEVLVAVLVAVIASFAVARSRQLVQESVRAERARENLARYFSPEVAAELASDEHDLGAARRQHAAVLFADIVGFTRLSESLGPEGTIALLREWHGRLGDIVFRNGGTLDKYIGDGLMATFGTPIRARTTRPAPSRPPSRWRRRRGRRAWHQQARRAPEPRADRVARPGRALPHRRTGSLRCGSGSDCTTAPWSSETSATNAGSSSRCSATR